MRRNVVVIMVLAALLLVATPAQAITNGQPDGAGGKWWDGRGTPVSASLNLGAGRFGFAALPGL